jgi:hypothetical protein
MNHYVDQVIRLSTRHPSVRRRVLEVIHLLRPPSALLSPGVLGRVAWAWFTGGAADEGLAAGGEAADAAAAAGALQRV